MKKTLVALGITSAALVLLGALFALTTKKEKSGEPLRLIYWNIQNGMWSGQVDNYDEFVGWVNSYSPDVCVWAEAQTIYHYGTDTPMPAEERYLIDGWDSLAARYGHSYVYVGGHRDDYPQVITSRYPIENKKRIIGSEPDSVVTHGAGWATIEVNGQEINIVTLHTWPQKWAFRATDKDSSRKANGGDHYRRMEMEYIIKNTIATSAAAEDELWMMMGDFNSRSRVDNAFYEYPDDDTRLLVHDYIHNETPYIDVIAECHPGEFHPTMPSASRIDFVYMTPALFSQVKSARVGHDYYTEPVKVGISNFYYPSDHRPIIVDMEIMK